MSSDRWSVTIYETITYQRDFTRADLARLLNANLDAASDSEIVDLVTGNAAVEEALQHYGNVELDRWQITPADQPARRRASVTPPPDAATHDDDTAQVLGRELGSEHVLIGEAGGLSAVYTSRASSAMPGLVCVETEHGPLFLDPDHPYTVLAQA
jgi:hypothetical protein